MHVWKCVDLHARWALSSICSSVVFFSSWAAVVEERDNLCWPTSSCFSWEFLNIRGPDIDSKIVRLFLYRTSTRSTPNLQKQPLMCLDVESKVRSVKWLATLQLKPQGVEIRGVE